MTFAGIQREISAPARSHQLVILQALLRSGWTIDSAPTLGRLDRNGQKFVLKTPSEDLRVRIFTYKITESHRGNPLERRIEITSTYPKGLRRARSYRDIVIGVGDGVFVGVDPRRIGFGGKTGNASSFFDRHGLQLPKDSRFTILQRRANLFPEGIEYHAFLRPHSLADYVFNSESIHLGDSPTHLFPETKERLTKSSMRIPDAKCHGDTLVLTHASTSSRMRDFPVSKADLEELESGKSPNREMSPGELEAILRRMAENGRLGEEFVLNRERRKLRRAGRSDLAAKVRWVSQTSVSAGYDIHSFNRDGSPHYIEVKATVGSSKTFEISANEWRTAARLGAEYTITRVTNVRTSPRTSHVRDPWTLHKEGKLIKTPSGWLITLN